MCDRNCLAVVSSSYETSKSCLSALVNDPCPTFSLQIADNSPPLMFLLAITNKYFSATVQCIHFSFENSIPSSIPANIFIIDDSSNLKEVATLISVQPRPEFLALISLCSKSLPSDFEELLRHHFVEIVVPQSSSPYVFAASDRSVVLESLEVVAWEKNESVQDDVTNEDVADDDVETDPLLSLMSQAHFFSDNLSSLSSDKRKDFATDFFTKLSELIDDDE
ncbi:hypothetical protein GEMRC1_001944 [Eukaryota sp. GEM-RC1]